MNMSEEKVIVAPAEEAVSAENATTETVVEEVPAEVAPTEPTPETTTPEPQAQVVGGEAVEEKMPESMAVLIPATVKAEYAKRRLEILRWEVVDINQRPFVRIKLDNGTIELVALSEWK